MEGLLQLLLAGTGLLAAFALFAVGFGADSRDGYGDDHAARTRH
jgi:hypothetical protein